MKTALAILSSRESPQRLGGNVRAALASLQQAGGMAVLYVVVNGNPALAEAMVRELRTVVPPGGVRLMLYEVLMADKAAAWNQALHDIMAPAELTVFVDGYAQLRGPAIGTLHACAAATPQALAVSGVPYSGWSARRLAADMRVNGGIHGNLYALKAATVEALRAMGFRLPLGIYRTDPTLGAALSFGLGLSAPREWRPAERMALADAALWTIPRFRWWTWKAWAGYRLRRDRQAQGWLENAAVRHSYQFKQRDFADLPATARELVGRWIDEDPQALSVLDSRKDMALAWRRLSVDRDWSSAAIPAKLLFSAG
ncbi:MAG: hypothetical protein QM788_17165 [Roseateles sp.]|uniref:hypothetical protein n=1 Tax=Roseateles sp. TaxID=1971397 RepID=UPI0039ED0239